ncbi:transglutaminase [Bacteroidota bacterium]
MNDLDILLEEAKKESKWYKKPKRILSSLIIITLSIIVTFPIFIVVYRYIPDLIINLDETRSIRIDHVLTFTSIFFIVGFILNYFRYLFIGIFIIVLLVLIINQIRGRYSFSEIRDDYSDLITYMESNPVEIPFIKETKMTIRNADKIKKAINYTDPDLRTFAVSSSLEHFNSKVLYRRYGNIIRYFSIFKVLNKWNYVPDPVGDDYYAKSTESIVTFGGDCDDYSILMAACIKSVGGEVRLIHTKRHLYPEVKIEDRDEFLGIVYLIKRELFYKESLGRKIYYHLDSENNIWLNFDNTARYPGGRFLHEEIIGILKI